MHAPVLPYAMNSNTREALKEMIDGVENIVQSCLRDIGMEDVAKIIEKCENVKKALDADETIP